MTSRVLAVFALCLAPVALRAADDDNPYKNVKVGDYATYKMKVSVGPLALDGTTTQTITAKTEKEAKVKVTASVNGMEAPAQEQTVDEVLLLALLPGQQKAPGDRRAGRRVPPPIQ